jgi:DNA-binding NarL/FixJ family response regulator
MASRSSAREEPVGVLICDDQPEMRDLIRIIVELNPDLRVVGEAGDGNEAVLQAAALQPDVILLDLSMPVLSGLEALPEIRRVAPGSAVVAFTGLDEDVVGHAVRHAGASSFLQKGADPDGIAAAIRDAHTVHDKLPGLDSNQQPSG